MTVVIQGANVGFYDGCASRIRCHVSSTKAGGGKNRQLGRAGVISLSVS
jgi:hypothetical protein